MELADTPDLGSGGRKVVGVQVPPGALYIKFMEIFMYTFNVSKNEDENSITQRDYNIFVWHDEHEDNVGIHIPEVKAVMFSLGIYGEDQENCFSGLFCDEYPNVNSIINYLKNVGWSLDKTL